VSDNDLKPPVDPNARPIAATFDKRGNPVWTSQMSPPDSTYGLVHMVPDRIIPVIFVPGVMGSNLKGVGAAAGTDWTLNSASSMAGWALRDAEVRKAVLTPSTMTLDDGGALPDGTQQTKEELKRRGWGEVGAMSYSSFLVWLENALNDFHEPHEGERVALMKAQLSALVGEEPLTKEEIGLSYRYRLPVHACGYNWLESNADSAKALGKRIDLVIARYKAEKKKCEKVIIVTHSMGGLVARHCSEVGGFSDKIFGIVHGVMPAIGAAAVYRRFKSGTETPPAGFNPIKGLEGWVGGMVLGNNAAEMTAVLSSAPGPMQLLPTPQYGNGWLKIKDVSGEHSFPKNSDPYSEIYTVRGKWWSMCEDSLINPLNKERDDKRRKARMDTDWTAFANLIGDDVKRFHNEIKDAYHPTTHAFLGSHKDNKAFGGVTWTGSTGITAATLYKDRAINVLEARMLTKAELADQDLKAPEIERTRTVEATYADKGWFSSSQRSYRVSDPEEDGDGTVPHRSGIAPKPYCQSLLQVKVGHEPAYNRSKGPDHIRACQFTLRAIVKIAQAVQKTALKYD
jgi:PGAP1-like protein